MLPMRFFRNRGFAATNGVSLAMFFGAFGSIFLLAQFFQVAQGYSPLEAGVRTLPWTAMPIFVAPVAGILSDRIGSRPLMAARAGAPGAGARLPGDDDRARRGVRPARAGLRDGGHRDGARVRAGGERRCSARCGRARRARRRAPTNTIREVGGVLGVAVLATVFTERGRLRLAAGVRRRPDPGGVGGLGGAGGRRARGAPRSRGRRAAAEVARAAARPAPAEAMAA